MSGDVGLHEQPIIFYHRKMTMAKMIVLQHRGINLNYKINSQKDGSTITRRT